MLSRKAFQTKVEVLKTSTPTVYVDKEALQKMYIYIDEHADEIGWLGTAEEHEGDIFIDDVYLFKQEVHSTTTEITPEGLSEFGESLLELEDGMEIWNNIRVWGHSHVNMGVTPSSQDDKQMEAFHDIGFDWFIRIIGNKKGEMKIDLYHYKNGIIYLDVPWDVVLSEEETEIHDQIAQLEEYLETLGESQIELLREPIKLEIKEKVTKLITNYTKTTRVNGYNYGIGYGYNYNQKKTNQNTQLSLIKDTPQIKNMDDLSNFFLMGDIIDIAECENTDDVRSVLHILSYDEEFTDNELNVILGLSRNYITEIYGQDWT